MAPNSSLPLVDRILDGRLREYLTEARDEGKSFENIAFDLRAEHDIEISVGQVRRWIIEFGLPTKLDRAAS